MSSDRVEGVLAILSLGFFAACASEPHTWDAVGVTSASGPISHAALAENGVLELRMTRSGAIFFDSIDAAGWFSASGLGYGFREQYYGFLPAGQTHRISLPDFIGGVRQDAVPPDLADPNSLKVQLGGCLILSGTWPASHQQSNLLPFQIQVVIPRRLLERKVDDA